MQHRSAGRRPPAQLSTGRRGAATALALGACALATASVPAAAAAVTPSHDAGPPPEVFNGRIAFTSFRVDHDPGPGTSFNGDIFTITPGGRDLRQLTDDPAYDAQADWSPDGRTIAYRIRKPNSRINFEVARMPAGGGQRTILTTTETGFASSMPSWLPDGSGLLFRRSGSGTEADVWRMGPFGEDPRLLAPIPGNNWYPSMSSDGRTLLIATTLSPVGDTDRGIFVADADGSRVRLVYDAPGVMDTGPAWAPDGETVAFESESDPLGENPEGDREIFTVGVDGSAIRQLTRNTDHDEGAAYSPDGTMIVYSGGPDPLHGDIKVMTVAGEHVAQLTTFEGRDESPDWQPIPAPRTDRRCGDLPEEAVRDIRSRDLGCRRALRTLRRWLGEQPDRSLRGRIAARVNDFGGTRRVLLKRRGHPERLVAFLWEPERSPAEPPIVGNELPAPSPDPGAPATSSRPGEDR